MMKNSKTKSVRTMLGIVIGLGVAGTFFSYLGAAPGYENLFRALMMIVMLSIVIVASRALTTIKSISSLSRGRFYDIRLTEVCK